MTRNWEDNRGKIRYQWISRFWVPDSPKLGGESENDPYLETSFSGAVSSEEEHLTFNQGVGGPNPPRLTLNLERAPDFNDRNVAQSYSSTLTDTVSCQCREVELATLSEVLTAYFICAKAEGKSPKAVSRVSDAIRHFGNFLDGHTDLITLAFPCCNRFEAI